MSTALCRILEWDSAFFGLRIGRVTTNYLTAHDMPKVLDWCREQKVRCLYFLCASDHDESVQLAELHEFHLVDVRIELIWKPLADGEIQLLDARTNIVRPYRNDDKLDLLKIAETAYYETRFYYDHNFAREQASALYREWIAKSCDGFTDTVLVASQDDDISGFITCHVDSPRSGRIGLVGVKNGRQGLGIGKLLVRAAQAHFIQHGVNEVIVVTQGRNLVAQRLYQRCGFCSHALYLWYHKWFTGS
ncbi:MAG: GNAT family N-acetyltransferase [Chloroflexota bacterium]